MWSFFNMVLQKNDLELGKQKRIYMKILELRKLGDFLLEMTL